MVALYVRAERALSAMRRAAAAADDMLAAEEHVAYAAALLKQAALVRAVANHATFVIRRR